MTLSCDIWIVSPPNYLHSRCFEEVALSLQQAFIALGYHSRVVTDQALIQGPAVVLGSHLCVANATSLPPHLILFNLEQIGPDIETRLPGYINLLRGHAVWDYSALNLDVLRTHGVHATLCNVGYMPQLSRIKPAHEDIDVLFIGSGNERRSKVLSEIGQHGRNVVGATNAYGKERDALIARAKILINLHYYDTKHIFEIVRVSYYLANRKCVVSELGNDPTMEAPVRDGMAFVQYEQLAPTCMFLLNDPAARARFAEKGFERFSAMSQVPMLERALATLPEWYIRRVDDRDFASRVHLIGS